MPKKPAPPKPLNLPHASTTLLVKPDEVDPYAAYIRTLPELETGVLLDGYPGGPSSATVRDLAEMANISIVRCLSMVLDAQDALDPLLKPNALNRTSRRVLRRRIFEGCRAMRQVQGMASIVGENVRILALLALPEKFQANLGRLPAPDAQLPPGPQIPDPFQRLNTALSPPPPGARVTGIPAAVLHPPFNEKAIKRKAKKKPAPARTHKKKRNRR